MKTRQGGWEVAGRRPQLPLAGMCENACSRRHAGLQHCTQAAHEVVREQAQCGRRPAHLWGRYEGLGRGSARCGSARLDAVRAAEGKFVGVRTGESGAGELRLSVLKGAARLLPSTKMKGACLPLSQLLQQSRQPAWGSARERRCRHHSHIPTTGSAPHQRPSAQFGRRPRQTRSQYAAGGPFVRPWPRTRAGGPLFGSAPPPGWPAKGRPVLRAGGRQQRQRTRSAGAAGQPAIRRVWGRSAAAPPPFPPFRR